MKWKFTGDRPVYQQIMEHMRAAVLTGEFPAGGRIPSVRELAALSGVNPNTVQRALTELEREGLLVSGGTVGRRVTEEETVLGQLRLESQRQAVLRCAGELAELGLTLDDAAALMRTWQEQKEETP